MTTQKITRFVVVDANPEGTIFFKVMLMNRQYQNITFCSSGEEALETIDTKRIQFIIASWEMPKMSGPAFVQRVKAQRQFAHIPFVIYSTKMSSDELKLTNELGLRNVIRMPAMEEDAFEVIKNVLDIEENLDPIELTIRNAELLSIEKQFPQAINELKPALIRGAFYHRAQTLLGSLYYSQNMLPEAEKAVNEALGHDDTHPEALHLIARIYTRSGRHAEAIAMLQKMSLESPLNIQNLIGLVSAYIADEQDEAAKVILQKAEAIDPDHPGIREQKGKLAFKGGDYGMAKQLLTDTANPDEIARHLNNVAIAIVAKSDFSTGIKAYEAAMGILNDKTLSHVLVFNLALALKKKGELRQAFDVLAKCYEGTPSFEKAYVAMAHVVKELEQRRIVYDRELANRLKTQHDKNKAS